MPDCDLNEPGGQRRMRSGWTTRTWGGRCSPEPSTPTTSAAGARGRTTGALGLSVQHEVMPRVSLTVAFNRNWWGNWYVVDNRATNFADYTPFSIAAPLDPRLPGRRRLHDRRPVQPRADQGRARGRARAVLQELRGSDGELARRRCTPSTARLRNGLTVQGGARAPDAGSRTAAPCARSCRNSAPARRESTNSSVTANVNALGGGPFALGERTPIAASPNRTERTSADSPSYVDPESGRAAGRDVGRASPETPCGRTTSRPTRGSPPDRSRSGGR